MTRAKAPAYLSCGGAVGPTPTTGRLECLDCMALMLRESGTRDDLPRALPRAVPAARAECQVFHGGDRKSLGSLASCQGKEAVQAWMPCAQGRKSLREEGRA